MTGASFALTNILTMLIPTRYKTRLPRELTYPIGAEALSEQLDGVPQFSEFRLCFSDLVSAWKSKFQRIIAEGADYEIVAAHLWSPFDIYVYPVKRELKHLAKEALFSHGLPKMREWLLRQSSPSPLKLASGSIIFSPSTKTVHFEERSHMI